MGFYEDLLKRNIIKENDDGSVSLNKKQKSDSSSESLPVAKNGYVENNKGFRDNLIVNRASAFPAAKSRILQNTNTDENNNKQIGSALLNLGQPINIDSGNTSNLDNKSKFVLDKAVQRSNSEKDYNKYRQEQIKEQTEQEAIKKAQEINSEAEKGNYLPAIGHVLAGVPQKALDSTATAFAAMNSLVAPKRISSSMADENELLKTNRTLTSKYGNTTNQINNGLIREASNASATIGGMAPSILANIAMPGLGTVVQGVNVGAEAYQDTLNEDATNKVQAGLTGVLKGTASSLIEKISGGNIIGKGSLDDAAAKIIEKRFKSNIGQKLASKAYGMLGEIGEENLENQVGYVIDKLVNNKDFPSLQERLNEAGETTKGTFIVTLILDLLGLGGSTYNDVQDIKAQRYVDEAKNIIRNELNTNNNIDIDNRTQALNNLNNVNSLQEYDQFINNNMNLQQNQAENENISQTQQIIQQENKTAQNPISNEIDITSVVNEQNRYENRIQSTLNTEIEKAIKDNTSKGKVILGKATENIAQKVKTLLGIDVTDRNHTLTDNDIRHMLNEHGDQVKEAKKGQIAITTEDISRIPQIINSYDDIVKGSNNKGGESIRYIKNFEDGTTYMVEVVPEKSKALNIKTMWKKPTTLTNNQQILSSTPKATDSSISSTSNNIIPQNTQNMQDEGIIKELPATRLQSPKGISSSDETSSIINNSITSSNENVNNNYSMQNEQNNATKAGKVDIALKARKTKQIDMTPVANSKNTPGESINWNGMQRPEGKIRKHYRSIIESSNTTAEAKAIAKELMGLDTYEADSNANQLERADTFIEKYGVEKALERLADHVETDSVAYDGVFKKVGVDDIALGERLIQYYSKIGDAINLQNAIRLTATAGTDAGRMVQAFSILNHQTPTGQVAWIQRSVDKMNKELKQKRGKNAEQFDFTPEMQQKIMNAETQEDMYKAIDEVYEELGQQVTKTTMGKIDAWRYFSMLANPRTHMRNIVGNFAMGKVQGVKNKLAGAIEGAVAKFNPEMERTHTIVPASEEVKTFAKNDLKNLDVQTGLELNENKYNPKSRLENSMRTFEHDALENTLGKLFDINNKALEAEDAFGLKSAYAKSLSEYMTANKLTPDTITDKQLAKARKYAIEQAKEATFHQASALATAINQFSSKNGLTKLTTDAVLPFKKTPINVAKAGLEYSPVGLTKSVIYDTVQLRKGNITVNKYIDNVSKGLTGTGIALLGYALAEAGILKASGSDDKDKENYDRDRGSQTYSIQIGNNTYSLDWLAPTGIPLFIGAEIHEIMQEDKETKKSSSDDDKVYNQAIKSATNIFNSFTNAVDPMTEMSMLSGLSSTLKSYDNNLFAGMAVNATKSYVNQFVPTVLGQVAKTTDEYERSTTSTKTGTLPKAIDQTKNQIMNKIPGLRQKLPTKTDIWGNEQKQSDNIVQRGLENFVFPWSKKNITTNNVDKELNELYKNTGENSLLPDSINKNLTIDKQKYVMTSEEYAKYKKQYGEDSYKILNSLVSSSQYKKLNDSQKQTAIEKVYDYGKEQIKIDYAKNNNLEYNESKLSRTVNELKKSNADVSNYFEYTAKTKDLSKDSEKIDVLVNSNYTDKTKQLVYENSLLSDSDEKYNAIKSVSGDKFNIDSYLKYKIASSNGEFKADTTDDGTEKGKTVSGSAKNKKYNYIISMKNTTYMQKLVMYGLEYTPEKTDKQTIVNYVLNMQNKKYAEKKEILEQFSWITWYKDGSFNY